MECDVAPLPFGLGNPDLLQRLVEPGADTFVTEGSAVLPIGKDQVPRSRVCSLCDERFQIVLNLFGDWDLPTLVRLGIPQAELDTVPGMLDLELSLLHRLRRKPQDLPKPHPRVGRREVEDVVVVAAIPDRVDGPFVQEFGRLLEHHLEGGQRAVDRPGAELPLRHWVSLLMEEPILQIATRLGDVLGRLLVAGSFLFLEVEALAGNPPVGGKPGKRVPPVCRSSHRYSWRRYSYLADRETERSRRSGTSCRGAS